MGLGGQKKKKQRKEQPRTAEKRAVFKAPEKLQVQRILEADMGQGHSLSITLF